MVSLSVIYTYAHYKKPAGLFSPTATTLKAVGDAKTAPIEVLIVVPAILGYYSRVADKQLEIIAENLLKAAWEKANPKPSAPPEPAKPPAQPTES